MKRWNAFTGALFSSHVCGGEQYRFSPRIRQLGEFSFGNLTVEVNRRDHCAIRCEHKPKQAGLTEHNRPVASRG